MIDRETYSWVLVGYHCALTVVALVGWLLLCKTLKVADSSSRIAWASVVFTAFEAVALTPMTRFIQTKVAIRDEALNFLITHSVAVFLFVVVSCVISVGARQNRGLLFLVNFLAVLIAAIAWLSV